jgi:hypothetical protein
LAAQNVIAKLEAEGLQASISDLRRVIMAQNGAVDASGARLNTDQALVAIAQGQTVRSLDGQRAFDGSSQVYREGAMNVLAGDGRAEQIRNLSQQFAAAGDQQNEALVTRAINSNYSSLLGKAPDLVKGEAAAFTDTTGEMMAGYHPSTTQRQVQYIQEQYAAAQAGDAAAQTRYDNAVAAFNSAVDNIATTPALAAKFSGAAGREALATSTAVDPAVQAALTGLTRIDATTGKIS